MQKCVLISNDTRVAQQLRGWFRLFENKPYLEVFSSPKAFEDKYSTPLKQRDLLIDDSNDSVEEELDAAARAQKIEVEAGITPIKLLILDLDSIQSRPVDWISTVKEKLTSLGHIIGQTPFRTLILGYDDPNLKPERFRHEVVDDMVIKPLDQQLFLQKVELLLAEKPDINPTFLFRARAEVDIEIGKDAVIDEVAEFAISIRNPTPISEGVFALIHSRIFGTSLNTSRILGRVYASVRHPQFEDLWLVRFSLFGITNEQLAEVRKFIRGRQMPGRPKLASNSRKPAAAPAKNKLPPRYRIAVIDLNRDFLLQAQGTFEENFDRTAATTFPSYTRFLAGLAKLSGQASASGLDDEDETMDSLAGGIPGGRTTLIISDKDLELLNFEPRLKPFEAFLGRGAEDWKSRPRDWLAAVPKTDHEDFHEFLQYTATGGHGVTGVRFVDVNGSFVYAEVKGSFRVSNDPEEPSTLRLEVKQIDRASWMDLNRLVAKGATPDQFRFDALVIDGGLIQTDAATWLEGLQSALTRAKVLSPIDPLPRVFIMADEGSRVLPTAFMNKGIADFIYKPFDRRLVTEKLAIAVPQLSRSTIPENSPFVPCELTAQVCKTVELEELSEFGLTIRHPTPLRPRVFMRFFSDYFGETEDGVLARCSASIQVKEEETFKCHFVFFGCSDELHKRIRNWIREDYVQKKESTG